MVGAIGQLGTTDAACEGYLWYVNPYCMAKTAYQRITTPTTAEEAAELATKEQYLQEWELKFREPPAPPVRNWTPIVLGGVAVLTLAALVTGGYFYSRRP